MIKDNFVIFRKGFDCVFNGEFIDGNFFFRFDFYFSFWREVCFFVWLFNVDVDYIVIW